MVKISCKSDKRNGSRANLFAAGTVDISKDGTFEVKSIEIANQVIETYPDDFEMFVDDDKTTTTTTTAVVEVTTETTTVVPVIDEPLKEKAEKDELNTEESDTIGNDAEKQLLIDSLLTKSIPELKALAGAFPASEWGQKNKKDLIEFLKSKL